MPRRSAKKTRKNENERKYYCPLANLNLFVILRTISSTISQPFICIPSSTLMRLSRQLTASTISSFSLILFSLHARLIYSHLKIFIFSLISRYYKLSLNTKEWWFNSGSNSSSFSFRHWHFLDQLNGKLRNFSFV